MGIPSSNQGFCDGGRQRIVGTNGGFPGTRRGTTTHTSACASGLTPSRPRFERSCALRSSQPLIPPSPLPVRCPATAGFPGRLGTSKRALVVDGRETESVPVIKGH